MIQLNCYVDNAVYMERCGFRLDWVWSAKYPQITRVTSCWNSRFATDQIREIEFPAVQRQIELSRVGCRQNQLNSSLDNYRDFRTPVTNVSYFSLGVNKRTID